MSNTAPSTAAKIAIKIDASTTASGEPRFVPYWRSALKMWSVRWNLAAIGALILNALIAGAATAGLIAIFSQIITMILVFVAIVCSIVGSLLHQPVIAVATANALAEKAVDAQEPAP